MLLTGLRISGFKSFVEPVEFTIKPGLTGIVGPNGCGKSNLVEAIKWAMGESSFKNMRASGMDDVIFSGSGHRTARNAAEVTLFIDNQERSAPHGFNDRDTIEITRRIEREAGSVYRVNGKESRAKDVQLLFADASTGARSPSMVGQGRIGALISAKPRHRRQILEEAAGISGLQKRREDADQRLIATEKNLDRVDDIVSQTDTQLDHLKRQARQARRYRDLSAQIRKFEAIVYHLRWTKAVHAHSELENNLTDCTKALVEAATSQSKTARDQAVAANDLPPLRERAAKAQTVLQRLRLELGGLDKEETHAKSRFEEANARLLHLDADLAREQTLLAENQSLFDRLAQEEAQLVEENEGSDHRRVLAEQGLLKAKQKQEASEKAFNLTTREIGELNARRLSLENSVKQIEHDYAMLGAEKEKLESNIEVVAKEIAHDVSVATYQKAVLEAQANIEKSEALILSLEEKTQTARERENNAKGAAAGFERALDKVVIEAKTLKRVLSTTTNGQHRLLIDAVMVEPGYEIALGVALGSDLEIAIDEQAPAHWGKVFLHTDDPVLPNLATPLSRFVSAPDFLKRRLNQIGVIEPFQSNALVPLLKVGQQLVTRRGALWRWDGFISSPDADTPAARRLAQKNRLLELEEQALKKQALLNAHKAELAAASADLEMMVNAEREARQAQKHALAMHKKAQDRMTQAERQANRLSEQQKSLQARRARLLAQEAQILKTCELQKAQLQSVPDDAALNQRFNEEQALLAKDRDAFAKAQADFETFVRETGIRQKRLNSLVQERQSWTARTKAAQQQIAILHERYKATLAQRSQFEDLPATLAQKRAKLFIAAEAADQECADAQSALFIAENNLSDADDAAKQALLALSEIKERKARIEERLESATIRKQDLAREIAESSGCTPAALAKMAELESGVTFADIEEVEKRLVRLKLERERLGGVNLRAEQEVEELDERRSLLINERNDLLDAIRHLRRAISNLDREARERLLAAFDQVNTHFKTLFTGLFGGGTAELQLTTETEDLLEAGLDIMARPPGKKPQTMTLLSGGEQALAATALIFAVFLTNPAPICVLDEVDAPLDDANVGRFCDLLANMTEATDTRFLVVTHNPITMARMKQLFGVTMAERGVSQLVSVDLATAESYREAG